MTRRKGCKFGRTKAGKCRKSRKTRGGSLGRMSSRRRSRRRSRR